MDNQYNKHLPLNAEQNEGKLVLPGCQLLIKYAPPEQLEVSRGQAPTPQPPAINRVKELRRTPKALNLQDAQVAKHQRELLKLLKQMPEMENPLNRKKLFPLEFQTSRYGKMDLGGDLDTDLKIIIDKSNSIDKLRDTARQAMDATQSASLRIRLIELRADLVIDKPARKESRRERFENLDAPHSKLLQLIKLTFSEDELKELCFTLKVTYDDLAAPARSGKARELIEYLTRRRRISELIDYCKIHRPEEAWPPAYHWVS